MILEFMQWSDGTRARASTRHASILHCRSMAQPCGRCGDGSLIGLQPFDEQLLHRILGFRAGTQNAIRQPQQKGSSLFEHSDGFFSEVAHDGKESDDCQIVL